jgi:hypothetical protein
LRRKFQPQANEKSFPCASKIGLAEDHAQDSLAKKPANFIRFAGDRGWFAASLCKVCLKYPWPLLALICQLSRP